MTETASTDGASAGRGGRRRLATARGRTLPHRRAVGAEAAPDGPRLDRIRIVLVNTGEAGNVGQAARAMMNMGLTRLTLVAPRCPVRGSDARRWAMHAWEVVKHAAIVDDLPAALADTVYSVALTTGTGRSEAAPVPFAQILDTLTEMSRHGDVALVFGSETDGLTNADLRRCSACARLSTSPALPSLNLAQAVLLAAHAVYTHRRSVEATADPSVDTPATAAQFERLLERLWLVLQRTRALPRQDTRRFFGRIRRSLGRQTLTWPEVKIWLGVLGDVSKALDDPTRIHTERDVDGYDPDDDDGQPAV
ncbi:MAG: TrmH family RNA methyltransferase [Ardenticatenales bacterium]